MIRTTVLSALGLAAAAGGPMLYFTASDYWNDARKHLAAAIAAPDNPAPAAGLPATPFPTAEPLAPPTPAVEGDAPASTAEVFRFDVTVDWVLRRWPRVSTGMADLQLHGYRVPLVTGTSPSDLAGSLTYYFNTKQQVQRITFRGATGEPTELVALLCGRFGLTRRVANAPGLFLYEAPGAKQGRGSTLRIEPAPVVKASDPYRRFEVDVSIERPS